MAESDDDAWLEQLREALASTAADSHTDADRSPFARAALEPRALSAHPVPTAQPTSTADHEVVADTATRVENVDLGPVLDAIASLNDRLSMLESATSDLARDSRRSVAPDINQVEGAITRVLRTELPALLDARMSLPLVELADVPAGDVVALVGALHNRIAELEAVHRRALDELTGDRRQLIDDAVGEIRRLLFGA